MKDEGKFHFRESWMTSSSQMRKLNWGISKIMSPHLMTFRMEMKALKAHQIYIATGRVRVVQFQPNIGC